MLDRVLIVDTETTGMEPANAQVIEVGAILYSVAHQTTIQQVSTLLPADNNPAERVNRIKPEALSKLEPSLTKLGMDTILTMAKKAELVVAHNAQFDRKWFGVQGSNGHLLPNLIDANGKLLEWVCTCHDFEWPRQTASGQSLVTLALAHDIAVYANHRALIDCQLLAMLFDRMDNLQAMFKKALRPKAHFVAIVDYARKDLAKQHGFKWNSQGKIWERTMAIEDANNLPFQVKQINS